MDIRPKILSSCRAIESKGAIASGWQHLVAYAIGSCISLVESKSIRIIQTLNLHTAPVIQLAWAPENYYHDSKNPYNHRLASADTSGRIIIWNVVTASPLSEASESGCGVCAMHWISDQDISRDLLLVLHTDSKLTLWNAQTCTPLWKKTYSSNLTSVSLDPFSSQNLILHGYNNFVLVSDLSWNSSPLSPGREVQLSDPGFNESVSTDHARKRFSQSIKATAKAVISKGLFRPSKSSRNVETPPLSGDDSSVENPLQILYHSFRKQHAVFVYSRTIVIFDLILSQSVGEIRLDHSSPSFAQVYCCRQADALVCLHQNGTVSLYWCMQAPDLSQEDKATPSAPVDLNYRLMCESKSLRRGRNFHVVAMAVDPSTELTITVATSDGRLQFLSIESDITSEDGWPLWTLSDVIKAIDPVKHEKESGCLRLRFTGFHTGGCSSASVCCICPSHFLVPPVANTKHNSLIAVGTMRGSVQIWDLSTSRLWREYLLMGVPVRGLAWGVAPGDDSDKGGGGGGGRLALFAHGWQTSEGGCSASPPDSPRAPPVIKNTVVRVDLETGRQKQVLVQSADTKELHLLKLAMQKPASAIKPSRWLKVASEMTDCAAANITPIRLMKISNLGQYLAILYENWPLEIWDARNLVILKSFSIPNSRPVALTWSTVNHPNPTSSPHDGSCRTDSAEAKPQTPSKEPNLLELFVRETFILCTSPVSLHLFTMQGSKMDTMPISNTIVQSLPFYSRNLITCASWCSPMIAFGMADGCVAVRNLQTKETVARYMAVLVSDQASSSTGRLPAPPETGSSAESANPSCVRKLEFLSGGGGSSCILLVLCTGGVTVWESRRMILLCVSRFGNGPQNILVDAAWISAVPVQSSPIPTCALLGSDGSIRLAAVSPPSVSRPPGEGDSDASLALPGEYFPASHFEFNSPFAADEHSNESLLVPSLLPTNVALTVRHLLQHQPWRSTAVPESADGPAGRTGTSKVVLACPKLSGNFASVQSSADRFFAACRKDGRLCAAFESPHLSIAERCLLTAQLFGDTYETSFWRLAAYQLLLAGRDTRCEGGSHLWRRFNLTDLVWDEMAEQATYRAATIERVNRLVHEAPSTGEQNALCTQFLLLLGIQRQALQNLVETPTESPSFSLNIHRACLLASHKYVCELESAASVAAAAAAEGDSESLSTAKMNYTSSVKLLAASLISSNRLYEGVEMLCMLGMHSEACRYLEAYNEWGTAVWLAKCMLSREECNDVMRRWAAHLASQANRKTLAVLVLVYLGQHTAVLGLLRSLRQHQLAARYLEACLECGALPDSCTEELHSQVFVEFAQLLTNLGHRESAVYYADLAGELGRPLRDEIDFLLN
uniref:WD_REPEATS_REGION domain-containing protein n=2 Tax=Mesocestoides corti TaxID=53468 RepID=A0A5K3EHR6_MESCO